MEGLNIRVKKYMFIKEVWVKKSIKNSYLSMVEINQSLS